MLKGVCLDLLSGVPELGVDRQLLITDHLDDGATGECLPQTHECVVEVVPTLTEFVGYQLSVELSELQKLDFPFFWGQGHGFIPRFPPSVPPSSPPDFGCLKLIYPFHRSAGCYRSFVICAVHRMGRIPRRQPAAKQLTDLRTLIFIRKASVCLGFDHHQYDRKLAGEALIQISHLRQSFNNLVNYASG